VHLSSAIVFGLGFATILTLVVTPAALMAIANLSDWRQARKTRRIERREAKRRGPEKVIITEAQPQIAAE
jgi:multidrug efflux pump